MAAGGGGQFGIVVGFVFRAHPYAGPFSAGILAYPGVEIDNILVVINVSEPAQPVLSTSILTNDVPQKWKQTQTPTEHFTMNFSRGPAPDFMVGIRCYTSFARLPDCLSYEPWVALCCDHAHRHTRRDRKTRSTSARAFHEWIHQALAPEHPHCPELSHSLARG